MATQARSVGAAAPSIKGFGGELITPGHPRYDAARTVFNGRYQRRPALIARSTTVADVVAALGYARAEGLEVAVRGGGHSLQGYSSVEGGIVIDLSAMKGIAVDPEARTAWAQAGLTCGQLDQQTQAFGLATTTARVSTTGIAGLTLGSGSGLLERRHGLTCDNLLAAELVTADGELIAANERENPELLWGLRGGGGNFGIVTAFEYRLHPVGPLVYGGMLVWPRETGIELLEVFRELMAEAPDDFGAGLAFLTAPPEEFVPEQLRLRPAVAVLVCHAGDAKQGEQLVRPLRDVHPTVDLVGPIPYAQLQQLLDASAPFGRHCHLKSEVIQELSDAAIDALVAGTEDMPGPFSMTLLLAGGRAIARVDDNDTPIGCRDADYRYEAIALWEDPSLADAHIGWTRRLGQALEPYSTVGIQLNLVPDEGEARVRATFGPDKYARLVALKDQYDPDNVFHRNQNIRPTRGSTFSGSDTEKEKPR
jgi:hypothetical protein